MSLTGGWPLTLCSPDANPHLYVHNVPKDSNEDELRSVFGQYGTVANVRLKVNQKVGPHAVYAFVTFNSTEEARNALVNLQGKELRGRSLRIEFQRASTTTMTSATQQQQQHVAQSPQSTQRVTQPGATPRLNVLRPTAPHVNAILEPPSKRNRFETTPNVRYVASDDQSGLIEAISQLLATQRPDLLDSFNQFCEHWMAGVPQRNVGGQLASSGPVTGTHYLQQQQKASEVAADASASTGGFSPEQQSRLWPASPLSSLQQRLANEGNLELDQETGRWAVLLSKLLYSAAPGEQRDVSSSALQVSYPGTINEHFIESLNQFAPAVNVGTSNSSLTNVYESSINAPHSNSSRQPPPPAPTPHSHLLELWNDKIGQLSTPSAALDSNISGQQSYVWKGLMNRNEKRVLAVTLRMLGGEMPTILLAPSTTLSITLRSPYEEMLKKSFVGLAVLELQNPEEDAAQLRDYIAYFDTKDRAGVAKLIENTYAYIFPTSAFPTQQSVSMASHALLVIFAKSND